MPAPLAMPPIDQPLPSTTTCLLTESVVMIASAASVPPVVAQRGDAVVDALEEVLARVGEADQPGRADDHVAGADAQARSATCSATACVVWKPSAPV